MNFEVTLMGFSCRPNPVWILNDAQSKQLLDLILSTEQHTKRRPRGSYGILGYAGFTIRLIRIGFEERLPLDLPSVMHLHSNILDFGDGGDNLISPKFLDLQEEWLKFLQAEALEVRENPNAEVRSEVVNIGEDQIYGLNKRLSDNGNSNGDESKLADDKINVGFVESVVSRGLEQIKAERENEGIGLASWGVREAFRFLDSSFLPDLFSSNSHLVANPFEHCPGCASTYVGTVWDTYVSYNSAIWNTPGFVSFNNCYNYATTKINHAKSQPGRSHGIDAVEYSRDGFIRGAELDGLVPAGDDITQAPTSLQGTNHLVALYVTADHTSQHWIRRNVDGIWSHKNGPGRPSNRDSNGVEISQLDGADFDDYTEFVGYFECDRSTIRIL